ncbi:NuA4-domain-containing protein [Tothia fuscella]|uniref:Chromatin modification-related protein EAF6 n=1 Tax=Tothia fuscella TaxID=1048955 RepID=A0A9P4TSS5_9PEZI|nr:NuA4-domain-containing protein [Tothia fuscella]
MTENAPPSANATSSDSSRGMPYYDRLRRDLRDLLQKKRAADSQIAILEDRIYGIETDYLEQTTAGNIIKGFDNYVKGSTGASTLGVGGGTATRRKGGITEADRIFSRSSANFLRDSPTPSTTPSHAPTPSSSFPQSARESNHPTPNGGTIKGSLSKKKKAPDDDDTDSKSNKRGKITYGRD